jgi:hypothetical protein
MLHLVTHWPHHASASFWPQAINYAVWVFNRLPNQEHGVSPNEIWFSAILQGALRMLNFHVLTFLGARCVFLILLYKMAKKIPKWDLTLA